MFGKLVYSYLNNDLRDKVTKDTYIELRNWYYGINDIYIPFRLIIHNIQKVGTRKKKDSTKPIRYKNVKIYSTS